VQAVTSVGHAVEPCERFPGAAPSAPLQAFRDHPGVSFLAQLPTLHDGCPAPDAELFMVVERESEALIADRARRHAHAFRSDYFPRLTSLREEHCAVTVGAKPFAHPRQVTKLRGNETSHATSLSNVPACDHAGETDGEQRRHKSTNSPRHHAHGTPFTRRRHKRANAKQPTPFTPMTASQ